MALRNVHLMTLGGWQQRKTENFILKVGTLVSILYWCYFSCCCDALHVEGTWETETFFLFLTKFGFQKTDIGERNDTQGFIFGNVTSPFEVQSSFTKDIAINVMMKKIMKREIGNGMKINSSHLSSTTSISQSTTNQPKLKSTDSSYITSKGSAAPKSSTINPQNSNRSITKESTKAASANAKLPSGKSFRSFPGTLVVLERNYFVDFYRNRKIENRDEACQKMFEIISNLSYNAQCSPYGKENFLRKIPCPKNAVCEDEASPMRVVKDHQFTYAIKDKNQAKFWYVSLVACYLDQTSCQWRHSGNYTSINYDIWLVNGNPYTKNQNPLEYQFSFDRQDTVEIYLVFFICYLVLVPLQVHAVIRQRHIVPKLFTGSVALELTAVLSNVVHVLTFSLDGVGYPKLAVFGDIMDILARAIFMLILLVLAKGWAITRTELTSKPFIFTIWAIYGVVHILLYVWNQTEVDVIEDIDEYQTWPGWLILIVRTIIMIWFLYELKDTMDHEHQPHKLNFFLHFGAAALVWFIYLPIIALIALQVSPLWRSKLLLGITYSADCLAFAVMTHLLWPTRSQQYFLLASNIDTSLTDELEEFNEAPHVVNPYGRRSHHHRYPINYSFHDVSSSEAVSLTHTINVSHMNNSNNNGATVYGHGEDKDNVPLIIT